MSSLPIVDRLASADPKRLDRRWFASTWAMSLLLHGAVLLVLVSSLPRITRGLKEPIDPEARQVGIVLKGDNQEDALYKNDNTVFRQTQDEPQPPILADTLELQPGESSQAQALPPLDRSILATAGQSPGTSPSTLPTAPKSLGGTTSRTTFWNVEATGASFVFVIDRSASMSHRSALELAKEELRQSLSKIDEKSTFQVIFYNTEPFLLPLGDGKLLEASQVHRSRAMKEIQRIVPEGGTNHVKPLNMAFRLRPEVIYYLTDADMLSDDDVASLTAINRQAPIPATVFAIEFGNGPNLSTYKPLRRLAAENDGVYSYINVMEFASTPGTP